MFKNGVVDDVDIFSLAQITRWLWIKKC